MSFALEIDHGLFDRLVKHFPQETREQFEDDIDYFKNKFHKELNLRRLKGRPGIQGYRGGILRQFKAIKNFRSSSADGMSIKFYTFSPVAYQHEVGGTIKGGSRGKLAIPLSSAKKSATDIFTKRGQVRKRYKTDLKKVKGLFKVKTRKSGAEILFRRKKYTKKGTAKRTDDIQALFVLKDSIKLDQRLKYYVLFEDLSPIFVGRINQSLDKILVNL